MKYFKFLGDPTGWPSFEVGKIYKGSFIPKGRHCSVWQHALNVPKVWQEVPKPKKTLCEKIERLKSQAEKEGMKCEVVLSNKTFSATNPKDEWDGVDFVKYVSPLTGVHIKKVTGQNENQILFESGWVYKCSSQPSTEQAYIEQLKAKANELLGEIKEGDRFDRSWAHQSWPNPCTIDSTKRGWNYDKEYDQLGFNGSVLYEKGKWAKRVKERVRVQWDSLSDLLDATNKAIEKDKDGFRRFLASKLEAYLNGEIE